MERKAYIGCCTLNKEIEPSFRVNECAELEKASEVQDGEGGKETVMKGGNIETATHSENTEIMETEREGEGKLYKKERKPIFFAHSKGTVWSLPQARKPLRITALRTGLKKMAYPAKTGIVS